MGKSGVKVVIRTRPTATFAQNQIQIDQDENTITVRSNHPGSVGNGPSNHKDTWKFRYHQVLHNAAQDTVYDAIAQDIVHSATSDGINGTILAYGQTGSGKTFTMIGDTKNYPYRGIAPRAISQVFHEVQERYEVFYDICISYMEIYNDRIFDLLSDGSKAEKQDFVIVEDLKGTSVKGLTKVHVETEQDALDQLFKGELNRVVAEHKLNKRSNRSHCIYTFHIAQKSRTGGNERVIHSKLHLVDLAGSERLKKTMTMQTVSQNDAHKNDAITMKKESMYINQSLTYLEQCIVALGSKETRHIPYRQTKLTNVLKDSLGGNCNTLMFACVWGESKHLEETISTLKLAQRMMKVQNETTSIVETDPSLLIKKYERQIKELKQELNMHDALVERSGVVYDEFTPEQIFDLMKMVRKYIDAASTEDEDEILELKSVHQIRELFRQFKILVRNAENGQIISPDSSRSRNTPATAATSGGLNDMGGLDSIQSNHDFVGDLERSGGITVGQASDLARPLSVDNLMYNKEVITHKNECKSTGNAKESEENHYQSDAKLDSGSPTGVTNKFVSSYSSRRINDDIDNKNESFLFFKTNGPGVKLNNQLQRKKNEVKEIRSKYKRLSNQINELKETIDEIKESLQIKKQTRTVNDQERMQAGFEDDIVDEEEFLLMKKEREIKRQYRQLYDEFKDVKRSMELEMEKVDQQTEMLLEEFETWFRKGGKNQDMDGEDKLDDGEQFDKLEMDRIIAEDPASLAFFQAQKKMRQQVNNASPNNRRSKRR